jgi:hypothetical protein
MYFPLKQSIGHKSDLELYVLCVIILIRLKILQFIQGNRELSLLDTLLL